MLYYEDPPTALAALQRILDATVTAGGVLVEGFSDHAGLWFGLEHLCTDLLPDARRLDNRKELAVYERRRRRIIKAAQVIQRDLALITENPYVFAGKYIEAARALESILSLPAGPLPPPGSVFTRLVGGLTHPFEKTFVTPPGYTTDPETGDTDGPFIRFVEQTLTEFGVTKDGNQPYQRRTIAAALSDFKRLGLKTETRAVE